MAQLHNSSEGDLVGGNADLKRERFNLENILVRLVENGLEILDKILQDR